MVKNRLGDFKIDPIDGDESPEDFLDTIQFENRTRLSDNSNRQRRCGP